MSDVFQLSWVCDRTQHSGKESVPPRGSGWVRSQAFSSEVRLSFAIPTAARVLSIRYGNATELQAARLRTHPLPRGGTDSLPLCWVMLAKPHLSYILDRLLSFALNLDN